MTDTALLEQAHAAALRTADLAGTQIRDLHDPRELRAASQLFDTVWGRDASAGAILAPEALMALAHAGGQISAAFVYGQMVGATAAFLGLEGRSLRLHSHVTGVLDGLEGRGVGRALKWYQRAWCLDRGIPLVRWTFDPLIRRNAVLNLIHLGARVAEYLDDVYGPVSDARNAGLPTDRLLIDWDLAAPRVVGAAAGRAAAPDIEALRRTGAEVVLDVGPKDEPREAASGSPRRLVRIPADIEEIRRRDTALAADWAEAVRRQLGEPLRSGSRVGGVTHDGWYVLVADDRVAELKEDA